MFMGPGTKVLRRVQRGDQGISEIDKLAKAHDIRYTLGKNNQDIKYADDRFYAGIRKIASNKSDVPFNINQARLLKIKDLIPALGSTFGGTVLTPTDTTLLTSELNKLAQIGYGSKKSHTKLCRF